MPMAMVLAGAMMEQISEGFWNLKWKMATQQDGDIDLCFRLDQINKIDPDVIGFQEVRADAKDNRNQLTELQNLIPQYKHLIYQPVAVVTPPLGDDEPPGWEKEGLGLLSKHPVILSHVVNLTVEKMSVDKNKRILLHAQIEIEGEELNVFVVHFSYDKYQQCKNAVDLINFVASTKTEHSVLLGDFNAYNDFSWPVKAIMEGSLDKEGPCQQSQALSQGYAFVDAWVTANGDGTGYTFSNMPEPGLVSRPDRILVSLSGFQVISAELHGDGKVYQQKYSLQNKWQRLKTTFRVARETALGPRYKYTCYQDCGPHGSCRCGICVTGGDHRNCKLPICRECDFEHYQSFIFIGLLYSATGAFLLYSLVKTIILKCVLRTGRAHHRILFLCSNRTFVVALVALLVSLYFITIWSLGDTIAAVNGQLTEEMFPSDHLMIAAKLQFHSNL
ncbi:uncharacterized protein [Montipora foliosa]|uniref:uncharacterized protein isoform X2 n=1 Tax=Montipora foliosa TaxID=591990 RepID=UPI0035F1C5CD